MLVVFGNIFAKNKKIIPSEQRWRFPQLSPRWSDLAPRLRYPDFPMASLALEREPRASSAPPSKATAELIDSRAVAADLEKLAKIHAGNERDMRVELARRLKAALIEGRARAEQLL